MRCCLERQRSQREVTVERQLRAELHRLSTALRQAQENERRRIARELHDGVAQTLSGILLHLDLLGNALENPPLAQELLHEVKGLFTQVFTDVRGLGWSLRPAALDDLGLSDALRGLVAYLAKSTPLAIVLHVAEALPPLSPGVETALYRIAQEALANVIRHAQATQVIIRVETAEGSVHLRVEDNGRGFEPTPLPWPAPDTAEQATPDKGGIGLWSMRERAEEVGGTLVLRSTPGEGTTVLVTVPVLGSCE